MHEGFKKKLKLLDQTWKIEHVHVVSDEDPGLLGSSSAKDREIRLAIGQSDECRIETFIHEVGHAIVATLAHQLPHDTEENIVQQFAVAWISLIRSNPWVVKLIRGE